MLTRHEIGGELPVRYKDTGDLAFAQAVEYPTHTRAFDYDGSGNLIFYGRAAMGSIKSAAVWQIRRFLYDGVGNLTDIRWAGSSSDYVNIWDNRAGLSYG